MLITVTTWLCFFVIVLRFVLYAAHINREDQIIDLGWIILMYMIMQFTHLQGM